MNVSACISKQCLDPHFIQKQTHAHTRLDHPRKENGDTFTTLAEAPLMLEIYKKWEAVWAHSIELSYVSMPTYTQWSKLPCVKIWHLYVAISMFWEHFPKLDASSVVGATALSLKLDAMCVQVPGRVKLYLIFAEDMEFFANKKKNR